MKSQAIIVAFYSTDNLISNDFIKICKILKNKYEIIISYNGSLLNKEKLDKNIIFLKYNNEGYDLNCYMQGLYHVFTNFNSISKCIFLNNSIKIFDSIKFNEVLSKIEFKLNSYDIVALTKSFEIKPHYQSYLFGVNIKRMKSSLIEELKPFLKANNRLNRNSVIKTFELETISLAEKYGLTHTFLYKPTKMNYIQGFIKYILTLGFFDHPTPLKKLTPSLINPSTFLKGSLNSLYGFKKIKSTSLINKLTS